MRAKDEDSSCAFLLACSGCLNDCSACADDIVGEYNVSTLQFDVSSVHLKPGLGLAFLPDSFLGEGCVFSVQLLCDCSGPLFGFLVRSDDDRFLGFQVLACVLAGAGILKTLETSPRR